VIEGTRNGSKFVGSGVIISDNGYVVTAGHCVKDADSLKVTLHDGSQYEISYYFIDPNVDIGVFQLPVNVKNFRPLQDSNGVAGLVYNIGNAQGVWDDSCIFGTVYNSNFRRDIVCADNAFLFSKMEIFPGCSGGGIYKYGHLVGIVSRGGPSSCFAIPSNLIKERWDHYTKRMVGDVVIEKCLAITISVGD
jgi:serine protease Do